MKQKRGITSEFMTFVNIGFIHALQSHMGAETTATRQLPPRQLPPQWSKELCTVSFARCTVPCYTGVAVVAVAVVAVPSHER
ncbi:hypothetical protein Ddc_03664 [Ditylenchus destructor]|nr:hypothetical protein Ddc_03664 [Ditylenchus destructor]